MSQIRTDIAVVGAGVAGLAAAAALAEAPEADVLKLWEGLGYYSRARNLQKAAKAVTAQYGGRLPADYDALCRLPGIGAYTAGAIGSIAYGLRVPAVDGNVKRVAARLFGERESVDRPDVQKRLQARLQSAVPREDPGSFNQALMELGATLCGPRTPQCERCPLADVCDARLEGDAELLPVHEKKAPPKAVDVAVCILTFQGRALLFRRAERLLNGLYVFALLEEETEPASAAGRLAEDGLRAVYRAPLGEATHVFTHRVWQMKLYHFTLDEAPDGEWLQARQAVLANAEELNALPMPTAMRAAKRAALRILRRAENGKERETVMDDSKAWMRERITSAEKGENPTVILRMKSGYAVLGDTQFLPGYCVLLGVPRAASLNELPPERRAQFLLDMTLIGDALAAALGADRINYAVMGNLDTFLHAHIWARYAWEPEEYRTGPAWNYPKERRCDERFAFDTPESLVLLEKIKTALRRVLAESGYEG